MIDQLVAVMGRAGAIAREKKELHAQVKAASDYVTDADKAVDSFLIQALPKLVPGRVFTEESPIVPGDYAGNTWVVDPIDGATYLTYEIIDEGLGAVFACGDGKYYDFIFYCQTDEALAEAQGILQSVAAI